MRISKRFVYFNAVKLFYMSLLRTVPISAAYVMQCCSSKRNVCWTHGLIRWWSDEGSTCLSSFRGRWYFVLMWLHFNRPKWEIKPRAQGIQVMQLLWPTHNDITVTIWVDKANTLNPMVPCIARIPAYKDIRHMTIDFYLSDWGPDCRDTSVFCGIRGCALPRTQWFLVLNI